MLSACDLLIYSNLYCWPEQTSELCLAGKHPQHALVQRGRRHGEPLPQRPVSPAGTSTSTWSRSSLAVLLCPLRHLTSSPLTSQAFSDYQIQQMTASFVDQFGFNDEEFSEHDENIKWVVKVFSHLITTSHNSPRPLHLFLLNTRCVIVNCVTFSFTTWCWLTF